ncbi:CHAD domain-containing protein [Pseudonocardia sp. WMMC193]|uniref:CYTH and CHAD domain-containing protein n=1 Tax=Pseudonocardia sp. WMMC193 TaxID=2911965 RepID=UPI001F3B4A75|nr:CHAD domain-containing protein [Pseudonocardia sp. WMMC193]MCF7550256.1 CHAD domain-containing protein [Pseudonocardia sp. WMMC193]
MSVRTTTSAASSSVHYRAPARAGAPNLSGLAGVRSVAEGDQEVLEVERYDSPDLRLATSGIVLAVHRSGTEAHWHLDLPDAVEGEQLRVPAPPPDVEGVDPALPDELHELVRGVLRGAEVGPVGRIRRVRTRTSLRGGNNREIGALVRDEVQLATLGAETALENWSEAEVITSRPALADALRERLAQAAAVPTDATAEAELDALLRRTAAPAPERARGRKGSAGAALLAYLGTHADRLAAADIGARRDEEDAVHRMRVAARRIRSALKAYDSLLRGPRADALAEELRWLGRALAGARDLEVQEERIVREIDALPAELVLGSVQAQVTRHFARARAEARAATLAALDSDRYAALRGALERFLQDPPLAKDARSTKGLKAGEAKARKRFTRRLEAARRALVAGEGADVALHDARKAGKRARYAVEVAGRKPTALKAHTRALGEHQDAVVSREVLRDLGARAHTDGENGFTFGILYGRALANAARIEEGLASR